MSPRDRVAGMHERSAQYWAMRALLASGSRRSVTKVA